MTRLHVFSCSFFAAVESDFSEIIAFFCINILLDMIVRTSLSAIC